MFTNSLLYKIASPNLLCWVASAMGVDSATAEPRFIKDRIKTLTEAKEKRSTLKAIS